LEFMHGPKIEFLFLCSSARLVSFSALFLRGDRDNAVLAEA